MSVPLLVTARLPSALDAESRTSYTARSRAREVHPADTGHADEVKCCRKAHKVRVDEGHDLELVIEERLEQLPQTDDPLIEGSFVQRVHLTALASVVQDAETPDYDFLELPAAAGIALERLQPPPF